MVDRSDVAVPTGPVRAADWQSVRADRRRESGHRYGHSIRDVISAVQTVSRRIVPIAGGPRRARSWASCLSGAGLPGGGGSVKSGERSGRQLPLVDG